MITVMFSINLMVFHFIFNNSDSIFKVKIITLDIFVQHALEAIGVQPALLRVVVAPRLSVTNETESVAVRLDGRHPNAQV